MQVVQQTCKFSLKTNSWKITSKFHHQGGSPRWYWNVCLDFAACWNQAVFIALHCPEPSSHITLYVVNGARLHESGRQGWHNNLRGQGMWFMSLGWIWGGFPNLWEYKRQSERSWQWFTLELKILDTNIKCLLSNTEYIPTISTIWKKVKARRLPHWAMNQKVNRKLSRW